MRFSATGSLTAIALALCMGFAAGWWYRDQNLPPDHTPTAAVIEERLPRSAPPVSPPAPPVVTESAPGLAGDEQLLGRMLEERLYAEATAFYFEAVRQDPGNMPLLRPTVDDYVRQCLRHCDSASFVELVDTWLATFYDDITILLILAEYEEQQGQPEAAANTLLLARTYAPEAGDQRRVSGALAQLTQRTDERLAGEQRWIELLGYYEFIAAIDFSTVEFELRRALLYRRIGEQARGNELLAKLREADSGDDPQWTATLQRHLSPEITETAPSAALSNAIPLERRGDGYLVEVVLNDRSTLKLLVDTGASMTALTREGFRRLYRPDFSLLGTRLFNTANGFTRGDIYRASSLTLGDERIEGTDVAVLDFSTMDDIDGLLGMNVLRKFQFEIDQSVGAMYISRR